MRFVPHLLLPFALALLAGPLATTAPAAEATPAGTVTIVLPDGEGERTLDLAALTARFDVFDATYTLRAADGSTSDVHVATGISLHALLDAADVEPDGFDYVEVPFGENAALVPHDDALAQDVPPVVWSDAHGLRFLSPSDGEDDVNTDDLVTATDGTLTVRLERGDAFDVRIDASAQRVRRKGSIDFTAVVEVGQRPGLQFQWFFDEGGPYVYGARRSHRFRLAGRHVVILNVLVGGQSVAFQMFVVAVTKPPPPREEPDDDDDPPAEHPSGGAGTGGAGAGGGSGGSGSGPGGGMAGGGNPPLPSPAAPPPRTPRARTTAAPAGTLVAGTLLASAGSAPLAGLARGSARGAARDAPLDIPVGVWVGMGLAFLLTLGWGLEGRYTFPFWRP